MALTHRRPIAIMYAFTGLATVFGLVVLFGSVTAEESNQQVPGSTASDDAIARLEKGNRRCVEGKSAHGHDLAKCRERFLVKQKPFATVLGCSDSRVAPELLFDQGFGELFVIRAVGNIVNSDVVGSINEYPLTPL
ncbi:MAG: carbonic anhydrase [Pirellulaceae bacterium]|nr:carbonic anhydrase [Pirellulaceae bacterium]